MINVDRINKITTGNRKEKNMDEYLTLLRDINKTTNQLHQIGCESIEMFHVSDRYQELVNGLSADKSNSTNDWPVLDLTGNEGLKSAALIGTLVAANVAGLAAGIYTYYAAIKWFFHARKLTTQSKKAIDYFEKNIQPFRKNIAEDDFQSKKAKLLTVEQFQTLFKTAGNLNQLISKSFSEFKTNIIDVAQINIAGIDIETKTDKKGVTAIKKMEIGNGFETKKLTIGEAGWNLDKMFRVVSTIKSLLSTLETFNKYEDILKKQVTFIKANAKAMKSDPEKYEAAIKELVIAKQNLKSILPMLNLFTKCCAMLTAQLFTLSARVKVKKLEQ